MNDYDDSEDYSSASSFRARSNTWPLNRPEFAVPSSGICIDETLPEIELEDDDLFTTSENWSTGFVDHDIMSWDPILNSQSQQTATTNSHQQQQASTVHHHHQPQQQAHPQSQQQASQRQQQIHVHHPTQLSQQQPQPQSHQHQHQHPHPPQAPQQQQQPHQQEFAVGCHTTNVIVPEHTNARVHSQHQHQHQPQQQPQPQQQQSFQQHHHHPPSTHHQTLNSSRCLDSDDPNEYHIHQLHHLRLDNSAHDAVDAQQASYCSPIPSMCLQSSTANLANNSYISPDPNHQHLQTLTSARYDLDHQNEYDLKLRSDGLNVHSQHHQHQEIEHHQHLNHPQQHHQFHQLTSPSLDIHSTGLSSSLGTSGIGLSGDLEDLDYKVADASMQNPHLEDQPHLSDQQSQHKQSNTAQPQCESGDSEIRQSNSNSASKTKLNTPRRNAWGNMSYADLISQAINSTSDKRLTLSQIYDWMVQHVPYFKDKGDSNSSAGWKNSVRHNLSLHSRFKRLQNEGTGKSSWWTINPEANIGKCARRRAASMEASKFEKKRGRAKKRAEAIRQGLVSYPSLTNSSLNGSTSTLDQQPTQQQAQSSNPNQFRAPLQQTQAQQSQQSQPQDIQSVDQYSCQQTTQQQTLIQPQLQIQTLDNYVLDNQPSQQQQQHLQQLQQSDDHKSDNFSNVQHEHDQGLFVTQQKDKMQRQSQQSQYYFQQFELSTAL